MSTANLTDVDSADVAAMFGVNTHFKDDGSAYRDPANPSDPDPNAETVVSTLGATVWRERFNNLSPQNQAIVDLRPMTQFGQAGIDINSTEADCRNMIHAIAISSRKGDVWAFTGANEPNDRAGGGQTWNGAGQWWTQAVKQQYWIWDQVQIEVDAGNWTATPGVTGGRPYVVAPGVKHEHVPLDSDLAGLAAATYTTAGVAYHMADLCDFGDMHFYPGFNGPGFRMNGEDDNNDVPDGVVLGSDGKCTQLHFETQRYRQIFDLMLTGGTGALVSGHWKYTGGSVTAGHGATFDLCHSEWGFTHEASGSHDRDESRAWGAVAGPETLLRDFVAGCPLSIVYQAVNNAANSPELGLWNLAQWPDGNYPIFDALQTVCSYPGSTAFSTVGHWKDIGGTLPDCTGLAFSESATEWWLYVLREADVVAHLELSAAYKVEGVGLSGDGTYHLDLGDPLTIWHVIPTGGGGGAPVWTDTILGDRAASAAYTDSVTATGATSYSIVSGAFPSPMTFNTGTGAVGGTTPATGQTVTVVIRATNGSGSSDSPPITFNITTTPVFTADSPPLAMTVGVPYEYQYAVTSFPDSTFTLGGTAIAGMTMSPDGTYSGVPTDTPGNFTNHAAAANSLIGSVNGANHIFVLAAGGGGSPQVPVFTVPPPPPPDGTKGEAYDFRFRADDPAGIEDPTFSVFSGTIPPGLVLSAGGHLKSKPLVAGTRIFSIAATNSAGTAVTADLTVTIVDTQDHGQGQTLTYPFAGPNSACSFYPHFKNSVIAPDKSARFAVVQDVNGNAIFVIRVKQSGKLDIDDTDGNSLAKGETFFAQFDPDPSARWRCSLVVGWDGTRASLILRPYGELESDQASDVLPAVVASSAAPYQIEFGNKTGEVDMALDSISFSSQAQEIPPQEPGAPANLTQLFSLTASHSPSSIAVNSRLVPANAAKSVDLAWSLTSDMASPTLVGAATADSDAIVRHNLTGLPASTRHYLRLKDPVGGSLFGEVFQAVTHPATTGAWTWKIAVVSCMDNPSQGQTPVLAWQDVAAWAPDAVWSLGDEGYWGQTISATDSYTKDLQKYDKLGSQLPAVRAVWHCCGMEAVCISDHNLHANGDGWQPGDPDDAFGCGHAIRQMGAHTALFPTRTYMDTRTPKKHRGYFFDIGSQVRVIVTDMRTPERNMSSDTDGPSKQFWGAVQEAQIFAALDAAKVNFIVNETSHWVNTGSLRATDKPAAYPDAMQRLKDKLDGTGEFAGGTAYSYAWVGGDRHRLSYLSTATAADARVITPQFISSGMFKNALALQENEDVTWAGAFIPTNTTDKFSVAQWAQLTLEFDGVDTLTAKWNGRIGNTTRQVTDGVSINGTTAIVSNQALFTQADKGQLIAGPGIRNNTPTTILSVQDESHATLSQSSNHTESAALWTIQNNPTLWFMSDFPGGTPTVETWVDTPGGGPGTPEWIEG